MTGIFGVFFLLVGGGILGYGCTSQMAHRIRTTALLQEALCQMERELTLHLLPLPELLQGDGLPFSQEFSRCGREIESGRGAESSWNELVETLPYLGEEEHNLLRPLGQILGRFEGEVQGEALRHTAQNLQRWEQTLREERQRLGRVYPVVGATVGGFLGIFLL